jgi:thiopeptide-type bacteriocin biosynthesis protein
MFSHDGVDDRGVETGARSTRVRWLSYHLYLSGPLDVFLTDYLHPYLRQEWPSRQIRRFFFVRYSDDGLHLRLRFLPRKSADATVIEQWVDDVVRNFSGSLSSPELCRVERREYNREEHYFGETMYSVYAELLNEQTSWLGLRLLSGYYRRAQLMILLAACLRFFLLRATIDPEAYLASVESSRAFAADLVTKFGLSTDLPLNTEQAAFDAILPRASQRSISFLSHDRAATAIVRLMRRARNSGGGGQFVVTHALHLFCNKLGFSVPEEYRIFALLKASKRETYR